MARCDSYDYGQCTWGACEFAPWVPEGLGNGGDWAAGAAARGYRVTGTPTVGAACSYAAGDGYSEYGHVGIVTEVYADGTFLIHEMNYAAWDEYDDRVSTVADVAGFILPPGVDPGDGGGQGAGGVSLPATTGGGPAAIQPVIAAYDQIRWYFGVTADQQIAALQKQVQQSYEVG